ncbi:DEAD/DEAH box helicase [Hydrogenophilus thiooxidans]|uniref:DEAD/DEAH box helicase n=1 Tax=Hydrogenophilus thiooxidans TaxID=2820326 RepID=UPI001C24BEAD|nr:DEAD/DEAH box helicase [Hydrogenophilus thiooxidans]
MAGELGHLVNLFLNGPQAQQPQKGEDAAPCPARASLAFALLERIAEAQTEPPADGERLVFAVDVIQHQVSWRAWLTRPHKRNAHLLIHGTAVSWESSGLPSGDCKAHLTRADLYGLLFAETSYVRPALRLPQWLGEAFHAIVASGRAYWGDHTYGLSLEWRCEQPVLGWQWREDARGRFCGAYRVPEALEGCLLITNTWPWHYLCSRTRHVGAFALPEGLSWAQFALLQTLPPIPPEAIEPFARRWREVLPAELPPPKPVAHVTVPDAPRFLLQLTTNEAGQRQIEPQVAYGPVTLFADGALSHPFGEAVLTLSNRRRDRERLWFDAVALLVGERHAVGAEYRRLAPRWSAAQWLELRDQPPAALAEFEPTIVAEPDFWPETVAARYTEVKLTPLADEPDWFEWQGNVILDEATQLPVETIAAEVFARYGAEGWPDAILLDLPGATDRCARVPLAPLEPVLRVAAELLSREPHRKGRARVSRFDVALLDAIPEPLWPEKPPAFAAMLDELRTHGGPAPIEIPATLTVALRPYQQMGVAWLQFWRRHRLHGILADDMGLGKTLQTLAHLEIERLAGRLSAPALVVAPTSLIGNWLREAARFVPELRVTAWHGAERQTTLTTLSAHHLVVTSYALLWRDIERLRAQRWSVVILDEAQAIKNPRARVAQSARQLAAEQRLCLTGTPMENHLGELWALFDFLMPGFLGPRDQFTRSYRTPIEKHHDTERLALLRRRIRPFLLRRTKAEVAPELPPKSEIVASVILGEKQAKIYEAIRVAMEARVRQALAEKGLAKSQITVLDALLKLRQCCCDPTLIDTPQAKRVEESAKLDWLDATLPELVEEGRKVLIFSQFVQLLKRVEARLTAQGIPYALLTGTTRHRDEVVARFQRGEVPVFLISLKAGGTGLNLTEADTVILLDPWWNPAVEAQAIDRAHRIGQDKPVFIYKLICANTVEEQILKLQAQKAALAAAATGGEGQGGWTLTEAEIAALFAVTPVGGSAAR